MQLWNYNKVSISISGRTFFEVAEKIHYTPRTNTIDLKFGDIWLSHECNNWFGYAGGFRLSYSRKIYGWQEERRPMVLAEVSPNIKNFNFNFSGRFEYRWFEEEQNHFRFRQKLDVDFPPVTKWNLNLFAAEESFLKFNSEKIHLARVYAGINTLNKAHFKMKIYYSLEKSKSLHLWNTADIIGMNMNINL